MSVIVKRTGALGDLIQITPIVKRLAKNGESVFLATHWPELFANNPYVKKIFKLPSFANGPENDAAFSKITRELQPSRVIDLDDVRDPSCCDSYGTFMELAGLMPDPAGELYDLFWEAEEILEAKSFGLKPQSFAVFQIAERRDFSYLLDDFWPGLVSWFSDRGVTTVLCGSGSDHKVDCDVDLFGRTSLRVGALIVSQSLFVCCHDSFPTHCAGLSGEAGVFSIFSRKRALPETHLPKLNPGVGILVPEEGRGRPLETGGYLSWRDVGEMIETVLRGQEKMISARAGLI